MVKQNEGGPAPPEPDGGDGGWQHRYWRGNLRIMLILLPIWFAVPFLGGIVFVEPLNQVTFLGFPLGFWIAQQGSIYVFLILIAVYMVYMDRLDKKFGVDEVDETAATPPQGNMAVADGDDAEGSSGGDAEEGGRS